MVSSSICDNNGIFGLLTPEVISIILAFAFTDKISNLSTSFCTNVINPLLRFVFPYHLEKLYVVIRNGSKAPYSDIDAASADEDAIIIKYGALLDAIIALLFTALGLGLLVWLVCRALKRR